MKNDGGAQRAYAAYRDAVKPARGVTSVRAGVDGAAGASSTARGDRADISTEGRLRARAADAVRAAPETRAALVVELRARIQSGAYIVDEDKLATRLAQHIDMKA